MKWNFMLILIILVATLRSNTPIQAQDGEGVVVTVVGGIDEPQTYSDQEIDGFQFSNFTYRSNYPVGLEFRITIAPPEDIIIEQVTLFYTFTTGKGGRINATHGENEGEWIAVPYANGGLPPWNEVDASWTVYTNGPNIETEPVHAIYYDAQREWYRAESEDVIVYWFDVPEEFGQLVIDGMVATRPRYQEAFGLLLPYRPVAVVYPPDVQWKEYQGGDIDDTDFGTTGTLISAAGSTVQRLRPLFQEKVRDCIWYPADADINYQMHAAASTVAHETAHLYQHELGIGGPMWWKEGQATFFEPYDEYPLHERLRTLAQLRNGDLPSLQGDGPGGQSMAAEDGCIALSYDMGASFMHWLVDNYGGMETYGEIVAVMAEARTLEEGLEAATGHTLLELENEWRAFLGVGPVAQSIIDPQSGLDAPVEPYFEVGEEITRGTVPYSQPIYNAPTTTSIADAACFASMVITIEFAGNDGTTNWYEVDCMGMTGWMNQQELDAN